MAVIYKPLLIDLHIKVSAGILDGHKVTEIVGALNNLTANDTNHIDQVPADASHIRSNEDLDASLRLIRVKPIKLLINLHRLATNRPNTPHLLVQI